MPGAGREAQRSEAPRRVPGSGQPKVRNETAMGQPGLDRPQKCPQRLRSRRPLFRRVPTRIDVECPVSKTQERRYRPKSSAVERPLRDSPGLPRTSSWPAPNANRHSPGEDLERLAKAAFLTGRETEAVEILTRGHQAFLNVVGVVNVGCRDVTRSKEPG